MSNPIPSHYQQTTYLTDCLGNNGFDFDQRSETNPEPQLRIAPLIQTSDLTQLKTGHEIAFEVYEAEKTHSFAGLANFLQLQLPNLPPIYIFDNHNHAFYFWHLEKSLGHLPDQTTLIHVDQHKDSRIPANFLSPSDSQDLAKIYRYTNEILNVGNFIPPAIKTGLIKEMLLVDSSTTLENFFQTNPQYEPTNKPVSPAPEPESSPSLCPPFILDIDLDFFAPELDYIGNQKKLELIQKLLPHASVVTIASSPFFIDQQLAIDWCKRLLQF